MEGKDSALTSEFARDMLIDNLEELGRALVAFQQAYLELSAAVCVHYGVLPTEAETMDSGGGKHRLRVGE